MKIENHSVGRGTASWNPKVNKIAMLCALTLLGLGTATYAVDASSIEETMRDFQAKYHYVAVANGWSSKYLSWPSHNGVIAPSYPSGFYGNIVLPQLEMDKSLKSVILLWTFLKGIRYGQATQTI